MIDYDVEFLQLDDGDLLIVDVPQRKGIPHAYIARRTGPEIKERTYYIRTSHGKRLVSDRQLEWLFAHQEDPDLTFQFRTVVNCHRNPLEIAYRVEQPTCVRGYSWILSEVPKRESDAITKDIDTMQSFFAQISPYVLLHFFSYFFQGSWLVAIQRWKDKTTYRSGGADVPSRKVALADLPLPPAGSLIASLSWDFEDVLRKSVFQNFCIPPDSHFEITYENKGRSSLLLLKHDDFEFRFRFVPSSGGAGLQFAHPLRGALSSAEPIPKGGRAEDVFQFTEMDCTFEASFSFPDKDVELFERYYRYAVIIRSILEHEWSYDHFIEKLPHHKIFSMDSKLDNITAMLKGIG